MSYVWFCLKCLLSKIWMLVDRLWEFWSTAQRKNDFCWGLVVMKYRCRPVFTIKDTHLIWIRMPSSRGFKFHRKITSQPLPQISLKMLILGFFFNSDLFWKLIIKIERSSIWNIHVSRVVMGVLEHSIYEAIQKVQPNSRSSEMKMSPDVD